MDELKTICDWVRWGASQFAAAGLYFGHGTDNAWDEAAYLVLHTLHLPLQPPVIAWHARLTSEEREAIYAILQKRMITRLPASYLTHHACFAGLDFYIDERVLIPRSPMAELIENHFAPWIAEENVHRILDLCTGSGCIAIACAAAFPDAEIVATDISDDALAVAKINVEKHQRQDQITLIKSDVFSALDKQAFDVIISNPPYVDANDMANLPKEYQQEPSLALAAGDDGLTIIKRILSKAHDYLSDDGILIVEVGNSEKALNKQFPQLPLTWLTFERGGDGVFLLNKAELSC